MAVEPNTFATRIHSGLDETRYRTTLYVAVYPGADLYLPADRSAWEDREASRKNMNPWLLAHGYRVVGRCTAIDGGFRYDLERVESA